LNMPRYPNYDPGLHGLSPEKKYDGILDH